MKCLLKHLLPCIALLCLLAVGTAPANAARRQRKVTAETTISAISKDSISIKSGHATHTFKISSQTAIHVDGMKAEAKDLKKGMHAEVTTSQLDPNTASAIEASLAQ